MNHKALRSSSTSIAALLLISLSVLTGCQHSSIKNAFDSQPDQDELLSLMLPDEIKIQPFTKVASFNDDDVPDGVLAVVRPCDRFGDPIKAAGVFYFELWTYQPASGDHLGKRIAFWEYRIDSVTAIQTHWTHAQMYEFQLAWTQGVEDIKPGQRFVLTASYRTPWEQTLQDQYVMTFDLPARLLKPAS